MHSNSEHGLLLDGTLNRPFFLQEATDSSLPVEELGFRSVSHLLSNVAGVKVAKAPESSEIRAYCTCTVLRGREQNDSRKGEGEGEGEGERQEGKVGSKEVKPSQKFPVQPLPSDEMCPVYVSHMKTPSCLSLQLIGESTSKALESLQEDLAFFYKSQRGGEYVLRNPSVGEVGMAARSCAVAVQVQSVSGSIVLVFILLLFLLLFLLLLSLLLVYCSPGPLPFSPQCCCTIFGNDGYWYRAHVTGLPSPDTAEVCYVDYGNVGVVPTGSLRRLRAHHVVLPAQALPGRLANIKPVGDVSEALCLRLCLVLFVYHQ